MHFLSLCVLLAGAFFNTKIGEFENKIPDASGLVTTNVLNTKIGEIENKTPDHAEYVTTPEFSKFVGSIFDTKLK